MLKESLHIYIIDAQGNKKDFPSVQEPSILNEWTYTSERMAGAPTITGTLMHRLCLDDFWTREEFVEFNGERYYVNQVPTSSKDTDDVRYKHEITFVSERIVLENIYFFDVVTSETEEQYKDRYRSNNTTFSFYGTLYELVSRLNDSLIYSKLYNTNTGTGYRIVIDEGIPVEDVKEISFNDVYFATALQEIYNQFGIAYYWVGKTCHVGYTENSIIKPFEYGSGNGLLSVSKNNDNYRIINRVTGTGSTENIPYYYPNENEYGTLIFNTENIDKSNVKDLLYPKIKSYNPVIYDTYTYCTRNTYFFRVDNSLEYYNPHSSNQKTPGSFQVSLNPYGFSSSGRVTYWNYKCEINIYFKIHAKKGSKITTIGSSLRYIVKDTFSGITVGNISDKVYIQEVEEGYEWITNREKEIEIPDTFYFSKDGYFQLSMHISFDRQFINEGQTITPEIIPNLIFVYELGSKSLNFFSYNNGKDKIEYADSGITLSDVENTPSQKYISSIKDGELVDTLDTSNSTNAAKIRITGRNWIAPTGKLMPPIYIESMGAERFYNAINDVYPNPNGGKYSFNNLYVESNPMEGIKEFDDIKPSIKGMKNASGQLLGEIVDIAFDSEDSDDKTSDSDESNLEYVHSYFYVKLHVFDGVYGFNLFKQALESGSMTFNMTSGNCAGCAFEVGTSEPREVDGHYEFDNPVITDENGNLVKVQNTGDSKYTGDYIQKEGGEYTPRQQDTSKYEVWVALKKEISTYGVVMPNATNNYKPNIGDTFVITNILMPKIYVTNAENELKSALIKYMSENNDEKFTFNITLSRIYLQQNPEIASMLNENARLIVRYNEHDYSLYVSSFSCKITDDVLAEITVDVIDTFTVGSSSLRDKISESLNDIMGSNTVDVSALGQRYFLSKLQDDTAKGEITFERGIKFGVENEQITTEYEIDGEGKAKLDSLSLKNNLNVGENASIDSDGLSKLKELILSGLNGVQSDDFQLGTFGSGFGLFKKDSFGYSYLEIDKLFVRKSAIFTQLEIRSLKYSGGNFVFSPAGAKITRVEKISSKTSVTNENGSDVTNEDGVLVTTDSFDGEPVYRCWFTTDDGSCSVVNEFAIDDLVMAQDFNITEGVYDGVYNHYFWRRCVFVGKDYIDLSISDCAEGSLPPMVGDEIATMGNKTNPERQNIILINTIGENAPEFVQYENVDDYSLEGKMVTRISPKGNVFKGTFILKTGNTVEDYIDESVNGIEIGGRNLLMNSEEFSIDANASNYHYVMLKPTVPFKPNAQYVFSIDKSEITDGSSDFFSILVYWHDERKYYTDTLHIQVSDKRQYILFKTRNIDGIENAMFLIYAGLSGETSGVGIKLTRFKLEEGNKVTGWSPAPEDLETYKNSVSSEFEVLNGTIRQTVQKVDSFEVMSEELSERIAKAEIDLQPENIWVGLQQSVSTRNIFVDGSFEYKFHVFESHHTRTVTTSDIGGLFGSRCIRIDCAIADGEPHWVRNVPITYITAGKTYTLVYWHRENGASEPYVKPRFLKSDGTVYEIMPNIPSASYEWKKEIVVFTAPDDSIKFGVTVYNKLQESGYMLLDGMMLFEGDISEQANKLTQFVPCETDEGEATVRTGIDIKNREINVTTDQFNIYNNAGEKTASVNANGVLETNSMVAHNATLTGSLSCGNGVTNFNEDGSGHLSGGVISWDEEGWWKTQRPPIISWLNVRDLHENGVSEKELPLTSGYIDLTTMFSFTNIFTLPEIPYDIKLVIKYNGTLTRSTVCASLSGSFSQIVQETATTIKQNTGTILSLIKANVEYEITYDSNSKTWNIPGSYNVVNEWNGEGDILLY